MSYNEYDKILSLVQNLSSTSSHLLLDLFFVIRSDALTVDDIEGPNYIEIQFASINELLVWKAESSFHS